MGRSGIVTVLLAAALVALVDVAITRTGVLWAPLSIENALRFDIVQRVQTLRAARLLVHRPPRDGRSRVLLLGDSRMFFAGHVPAVERELARSLPGRDLRVENLAMFGVRIGDLEAMARHLDGVRPAAVVVGIGGTEMLPDRAGRLVSHPAAVFDLGWRDGPVPPPDGRMERWLRTLWPLFRYRHLARLALADRLLANGTAPPSMPDRVRTPREFQAWLTTQGVRLSAQRRAAYRAWRRRGRYEDFVRFLEVSGGPVDWRGMVAPDWEAALASDGPSARALDRLVERLARGPWASLVILMPENPLLAYDTAARYHDPRLTDRVWSFVRDAARRHGVPAVDGRRWMRAEAFADFAHLFPDVGGFQRPLARHVARLLEPGAGFSGF